MKITSLNQKYIFKKLKKTDFKKFKKLFYSCYKKKITYNFFKWRYFSDKNSFCYGVFNNSELIANVGMKSMKLNNNKSELVFSRHSSMVLKKFRGVGIYSKLLKIIKKKISNKIKIIIMWPNKNNFSSFGIKKKNIIKKKFYLYRIVKKQLNLKLETQDFSVNELKKFKLFINSNNNFFLKNFSYYKNRYLHYKKNDYFLNKFQYKKLISFYVIKRNRDKSGLNYVILDHFGSQKIQALHFSRLLREKRNLIFWTKRKINKLNYKLINHINLNIGFVKSFNFSEKNKNLIDKDFMIGDTDSFLSIK